MKYQLLLLSVLLIAFSVFSRNKESRKNHNQSQTIDTPADQSGKLDSDLQAKQEMYNRYYQAGKEINEEKKIDEQKRLDNQKEVLRISQDTSLQSSRESNGNIIDSRNIKIEENDSTGIAIDNMDQAIKDFENKLYNADKYTKKMKNYELKDKFAYCKYLLKYKLKDTVSVLTFYENVYQLFTLEKQKMELISSTQRGNDKGFLLIHLRKLKNEMGELGTAIYTLRPQEEGITRTNNRTVN